MIARAPPIVSGDKRQTKQVKSRKEKIMINENTPCDRKASYEVWSKREKKQSIAEFAADMYAHGNPLRKVDADRLRSIGENLDMLLFDEELEELLDMLKRKEEESKQNNEYRKNNNNTINDKNSKTNDKNESKNNIIDYFNFVDNLKSNLEYLKNNLSNWINLIFGNKQRYKKFKKGKGEGQYFKTESFIDVDKKTYEKYSKQDLIMTSVEFGVIPLQSIDNKMILENFKKRKNIYEKEGYKNIIIRRNNLNTENDKKKSKKNNKIENEENVISDLYYWNQSLLISFNTDNFGKLKIFENSYLIKEVINHRGKIIDVCFNQRLNIFASTSSDGLICIYFLPCKLVSVIKHPEKRYYDKVFVSANPFPTIVAYEKENDLLRSYSISGLLIKEKKIIISNRLSAPISILNYRGRENPLEEDQEKFIMVKKIGKSTICHCYLIRSVETKDEYAYKKKDISDANDDSVKRIKNDMEMLKTLNHPNVILYVNSFFSDDQKTLHLFTEYADGGDLQIKLDENKNKKEYFDEGTLLDWLMQICLALKYIHEKNIIHRDIKPSNILLMDNIAKLGDFGVAKALNSNLKHAKTMVATPQYVAPEIINKQNYSFKADIWSLGVTFFQLMYLNYPFEGSTDEEMQKNIVDGKRKEISCKIIN